MTEQPSLFESPADAVDLGRIILYALGDFQSRKKVLAERELALDRLRGALKRAFGKFAVDEPSDEILADELERLGAHVKRIPSFVAKHPFRVTVPSELAAAACRQHEVMHAEEARLV